MTSTQFIIRVIVRDFPAFRQLSGSKRHIRRRKRAEMAVLTVNPWECVQTGGWCIIFSFLQSLVFTYWSSWYSTLTFLFRFVEFLFGTVCSIVGDLELLVYFLYLIRKCRMMGIVMFACLSSQITFEPVNGFLWNMVWKSFQKRPLYLCTL